MPKFDVIGLGEAMVEFNQTSAGEPNYLQGFGGDTSNAIIAAARAGARCAYATRIGADAWGDALLALWSREGVSTRCVERDGAAPTAVYFVTHGKSGHQFSYLRAGSAASKMDVAFLERGSKEAIAGAKWLHVSGISFAISANACDTVFAAIAWARARGVKVSLDSNLRLALWPLDRAKACLQHAISLCDLFLPSYDDVMTLSGLSAPEEIVKWAHDWGARAVVLKLGQEGVLASDGEGAFRVAAHTVSAVDATGAGDCFAGNLLARLAAGDGLHRAVIYANAAAALSVQGFGAVAPLPTAEQVNALIRQDKKAIPAAQIGLV
jgi:2-dehydro-3-deoxygluconokinase